MSEVILDALIDSLKILAVLVVCNIIIALIEPKLSTKIKLKGKLAPLIGVSVSLLPQCGFSVVASDLFNKKHITVGTLIGVYLATSDEALPIFLGNPEKALHVLPLIALKFILGLIIGYSIDFILVQKRKNVEKHLQSCGEEYKIKLTHCKNAELVVKEENLNISEPLIIISEPENPHHDTSCECEECKQYNIETEIREEQKKEKRLLKLDQFLFHPLLHSFKVFVYVFIINIIFGVIIYYIGEDRLISFLSTNKYVAPLFSVIVGMIPNCASSVILSELYIIGGIGFGATLGGLCMNAGLGFLILFKNKKNIKENLLILLTVFLISVSVAYIFSAIFNFNTLNF